MNKSLYPRLAWQNLRKNARFYLPYILTIIGTAAAFYIMLALSLDGGLPALARYSYLQVYVGLGAFIIGAFSVIFIFYTNSFLIKQRRRELGLYNVLGMEKRHISAVLAWESFYTALVGIPCGIAVGLLFQSAVTALALRFMRFEIYYTSSLSIVGVIITLVFFSALLFACLLRNIIRQSRQNPIELLRGGNVGEKEPKTRILLTVIGILSLGGGYAIAITVKNAMEAFAFYFLAVILVIIGTYCLFTSVSIVVLKLLRRNKKFYYRTENFIGISGMLYRMKRNAVGLANICILSTMVLVAVSSTLSLFLGTEDIINTKYKRDIEMTVVYDPNGENALKKDVFIGRVSDACEEAGMHMEKNILYDELLDTDGWVTSDGLVLGYGDGVRVTLSIMTADNYAVRTDTEKVTLNDGEVMLYCDGFSFTDEKITLSAALSTENGAKNIGSYTYDIAHRLTDNRGEYGYSLTNSASCIIVVADDAELYKLAGLDMKAYSNMPHTKWYVNFDTDGTDDQNITFADSMTGIFDEAHSAGDWHYFMADSRAQNARDFYENNGGFFFLGVFLGLLFMMAAALIIYYKQITEGYEDCERYRIMRQVGLDRREIRKSVSTQILVVFFAPLVVAVAHIAFDFPLLILLLTMFGLSNVMLTLLCTLGTLLGFALVYGVVFALTARAYNRIVNR